MKVILLQDVAKIGRRFTIAEVPAGFAQNKLIPSRLAEPATPLNLRRLETRMKHKQSAETTADTDFAAVVTAIGTEMIAVAVEANEQGHLFQAIKASDIVFAAKAKNIAIPEAYIEIATPIKSLGEHAILLKSGQRTHTMNVVVVAKA